MNRFDKFLFLLNAGLNRSSISPSEVVDHLALVFDPNVHVNISQDTNVPVESKVKEYLTYILTRRNKPFWLKTENEL